jgi:arginyl-tRNA synthetase
MKRSVVGAEEHAFVDKYASQLAQAFNLFYHHHHILTDSGPAKKKFLLQLSRLAKVQLVAALELLGIESPEKM